MVYYTVFPTALPISVEFLSHSLLSQVGEISCVTVDSDVASSSMLMIDSDINSSVADDDDADNDEKRWLDALESGDLDDNGELRREKDRSFLTARQRALLDGGPIGELLQLPTGRCCYCTAPL